MYFCTNIVLYNLLLGLEYYGIIHVSLQALQYQMKPGFCEMIKCRIRLDVFRALLFTHPNPVVFENNNIFKQRV